MGLLDAYKKFVKTSKEKKRVPARHKKKVEEVKSAETKKTQKSTIATFARLDVTQVSKVIVAPVISEKTTELGAQNQYVFRVKPNANKVEIRKAVSRLYGVTVTGVRIINIPKKRRRLGRFEGYKSGYKKAVVGVKKGDKIDLLPQ